MGRIAAPYAVRGWVKIQTFTEYLDSLLDYPVWKIGRNGQWRDAKVVEARVHGNTLIAQLEGINDRNAAEAARGMEIGVNRDELPEAKKDEYYWEDLVGLEVVNTAGESLGRVEGLLESGAHDLLKVSGDRQRLIPFVAAIVLEVNVGQRCIVADWGKDY